MQLKAGAWGRRQDREGLSLVVQWLRPCAPSAGAQVQSLVRELDPTFHSFCMLQLKILRATTNTQCIQIKKREGKT